MLGWPWQGWRDEWFPNTDNHPAECLYASVSTQQSTQLHKTVKCENDYVSAKDNANENDNDVDEDFLDDDSNVDLMNVFQNTEDNPIEYIGSWIYRFLAFLQGLEPTASP